MVGTFYQNRSEIFYFRVQVDGKGAAKFPARTELCWTDEGSLLAVGNDDGSVEASSAFIRFRTA